MNAIAQNIMHTIQSSAEYQAGCDVSREFAKANKGKKNVPKISNGAIIEFYGCKGVNDTHGKWFTNCVVAPFSIEGVAYASSEHYFQCSKFCIDDDAHLARWCTENKTDSLTQLKVNESVRKHMLSLTPTQVALYGQKLRSSPIRSNWDNERDAVMWRAINEKFHANNEFKTALVNTGNAVLIERAPRDSYWGINDKGVGNNMLGLMLMTLRKILQQA